MIKTPALLPIVDNSGALRGGCISILKANSRIGAVVACLITISIKKNIYKKNIKKKSKIVTKGQVLKSLILTTVKGVKRLGNFFMRSAANNAVILNQYFLPYGTRIFGPSFRETRQKINFRKVVSLTQTLV